MSRIGVSSSLNFWSNSAVKLSGPGLLCAGRFLITVLISVLVMGLLRLSVSGPNTFDILITCRIGSAASERNALWNAKNALFRS